MSLREAIAARSIDEHLAGCADETRRLLARALAADPARAAAVPPPNPSASPADLSVAEAVHLLGARGDELTALCATADLRRREEAGEVVTYVVNRNINFTNVCVKHCGFCAFSRTGRSEEGYLLPIEEVVRRAVEARDLGATEVCIQAGLAAGMDARHYIDICRAIKRVAPELDLHAFSPEEIKFACALGQVPYRDYLSALRDEGLGSLPGTSAEILDDRVRDRISPGRITTREWTEIIETAHELGIPTTSTIMFGHVETIEDQARHMIRLRDIQSRSLGRAARFTEFVPLSFVHTEAPMYLEEQLPDIRAGATRDEVLALFAVARLLLGPTFRNVQVSWVKEGVERSRDLLWAGANDLGGTLINESISTSAGSSAGQRLSPAKLRAISRETGRDPAQRNTRYEILRRFEADETDDPTSPLDRIDDGDATFGSYAGLIRDDRVRFRRPRPAG